MKDHFHKQITFRLVLFTMIAGGYCSAVLSLGQEPERNINLALPTMGGSQFWTDHRWWYGWRVQQNAITGHWRLLDKQDVRRAWGSKESCLAELNKRRAVVGLPEEQPDIVILVHGLMRSVDSMRPLEESLDKEGIKQPALFGYASTRASVDDHAAALREFVENIPGRPRVSFVGHSLGNIVVRRTIAMWQAEDAQQVLPRLHRVVMLGPPNQGATIAKNLSGLGVFETVTGSSGKALGPAWDELQSKLTVPPCPFLIVAGEVNPPVGNPLVSGASDFVVSIEETKLEGATEHKTVPVLHSFLPNDPRVMSITLEFLNRAM
ncbi:MAG: lipase [Pirellulales bacterium]